jgi:hypothetical protein
MIDEKIITDKDLNRIKAALQTVDKNQEVVVRLQNKIKLPRFTMVGTLDKKDKKSIDLLKEVAEMSSEEKFCFFKIKDGIEYCPYENSYIYTVKVDRSGMVKTEQNKFSAGFTKLKNKNLVKRVSRGVYLINPKALIPGDYGKYLKIWENIG